MISLLALLFPGDSNIILCQSIPMKPDNPALAESQKALTDV